MWFKRKQQQQQPTEVVQGGDIFSTDALADLHVDRRARLQDQLGAYLYRLQALQPRVSGSGQDSAETSLSPKLISASMPVLSEAITGWFLAQSFIGHQLAGLLSQHWLINKACSMPARDAMRVGFNITTSDGGAFKDDNGLCAAEMLKAIDKRMGLRRKSIEFVRMGRIFGIRIAFFRVDSTDPDYYAKPFNPDGVTPGSYKGIVQVDPYWCAPEVDQAAASKPDTMHFYEPTWWIINGKRYHRSHLVIFRNDEVPDILKPAYQYGGVPVPQRILERVYAAERTANEGPQLAMTKRTYTLKTDIAKMMANGREFLEKLANFVALRDNYGVRVQGKDDQMEQFDTTLADLDSVIMTQYQLVAAAANVPATKLLGTQPKGFNSSGEYEEESYREELEAIQVLELQPLIERHHLLAMRSEVVPKLNLPKPLETSIVWNPLDSPTATEWADIRTKHAQADAAWVTVGAIDGADVRKRLAGDQESGYAGIELFEPDAGAGLGMDGLTLNGTEWDGAQLLTNQTYLNDDIVRQKMVTRDFVVHVTPEFADVGTGKKYRVVIDGHHSLAAALRLGVQPQYTEGVPAESDYSEVR